MSYKIYAATDTAFTKNLVVQTFPAHGTHDNVFIMSNLTNGLAYYFKMTALVPASPTPESGPSNIFGPATIGPSSGGSTVSGSVTFPPAAIPSGTPLYAGVYGNNGIIYAVRILNPVSGLTYSVPGVPDGTYNNFAIVDLNNNGIIDAGDITNASGNSNPPTITVTAPGPTPGNIVLTYPVTTLSATTYHQRFDPITINQPDNYNVSFGVAWGSKRPIAITLFSGPNVSVPFDMVVDQNGNGGQGPAFLNGAVPAASETYHFQVTFSDGTTMPDMTASITAVLNSFAQNLAMNTPVNSTSLTPATVPMLNWSAPATLPTFLPYTYSVGLYSVSGTTNVNWYYSGGNNSNGISSTTNNVIFNKDGSASVTPLPPTTNYQWSVTVQDANGNSAQYTTTYATP
jgi:hypothetical protein